MGSQRGSDIGVILGLFGLGYLIYRWRKDKPIQTVRTGFQTGLKTASPAYAFYSALMEGRYTRRTGGDPLREY